MATEVIMPKLGFDVEKAKIARWVKHEGDQVTKGEVLAEVETEKVTLEVEAYDSGTLIQIVSPEGTEVPVGQVIAWLGQPGEKVEAPVPAPPPPAQEKPAAAPAPAPTAGQAPAPPAPPLAEHAVRVSPVAERLAAEKGVDLAQVTGTGPGGRITKDDVLAAAEQTAAGKPAAPSPQAAPGVQVVEPTPMRRAIARRMSESKRQIPHYYLTMQADMTALMDLRRMLNEGVPDEARLSVNDFIVKALALTLLEFPDFNAWYENDRLERQPQINIGLAISLEQGLIAPAVLDCGSKTLRQIARDAHSLAERAREGKLQPEEMAGATITTSNMGMLGVESFQAIIVPPQVAILAIGTVHPAAVVNEAGQVVIRQVCALTLSADHRNSDGAVGARMLGRLREYLEHPGALLS